MDVAFGRIKGFARILTVHVTNQGIQAAQAIILPCVRVPVLSLQISVTALAPPETSGRAQ